MVSSDVSVATSHLSNALGQTTRATPDRCVEGESLPVKRLGYYCLAGCLSNHNPGIPSARISHPGYLLARERLAATSFFSPFTDVAHTIHRNVQGTIRGLQRFRSPAGGGGLKCLDCRHPGAMAHRLSDAPMRTARRSRRKCPFCRKRRYDRVLICHRRPRRL
jgi:hypothetical protein